MSLLRSVLFNICFYAVTFVLMVLAVPTLMSGRAAVEAHARRWARLSIALLDRICQTKVEFRGLDHLPDGAAIIASKHQSFLDVLALILEVRDFTFIYKRELGFIPLFGLYLRHSEQIAVDRARRGGALAQLAADAKRAFAANRRLMIFPEGTRKAIGATPAYKGGVARIAQDTDAVCVPVALNSGLFWPRRKFLRRRGTVVVEFLPPLSPGCGKDEFMQNLEARIEAASDRLVAEALANDPSLAARQRDRPLRSAG